VDRGGGPAREPGAHGRDYVLAMLTGGNASEQGGIDIISHISDVVYGALGH